MDRHDAGNDPHSGFSSAPRELPTPLPHAGLGIASFLIGLGGMVYEVITWSHWGYLEICSQTPLALTGAALGLAALYQRQRRKTFAVVGLCLNGVSLVALLLICGATIVPILRWKPGQ
jgi:hypothetical protein